MVEMDREEFEECVADALDLIPPELARLIDNVVVLVEDESPEGEDLLGLYDGVPLTERGQYWAAGSLPDRIFVYRLPTLRICETRQDVVDEVSITVVHEVAHYFGIDDDKLHELGWG